MKRPISSLPSAGPNQQVEKKIRLEDVKETSDNEIFPYFSKGMVEIILSDDSEYRYRFHRAVLERSSTWFKNTMTQPFVEAGKLLKGQPTVRYRLHGLDAGEFEPELIRVCVASLVPAESSEFIDLDPVTPPESPKTGCATAVRGHEHVNEHEKVNPGYKTLYVTIKEEHIERIEKSSFPIQPVQESDTWDWREHEIAIETKALEIRNSRLESYNNLFLMFYNKAPLINDSSVDIALGQCETMIKLAEFYGCLDIVGPYLGNALCQFRQDLYKTIHKDALRWLSLAISIRSGAIFTEAMIHCVGDHPQYDWVNAHKSIPQAVIKLITEKYGELTQKRIELERNLYLITIHLGDAAAGLGGGVSGYESWMVVSIFRNWLSSSIKKGLEQNTEHHPNYLRLMRKGGDAYLSFDAISQLVQQFSRGGSGHWNELRNDLNLIKTNAQKLAKEVTKNNLMLDVGEAHIKYLTCTQIEPKDYPWAAKTPLTS